jgi:class 3 adenylate cyclase
MEPQIQYVTTADGVRIAYYTLGTGPAVLTIPSLPVSHLQLEWHTPGARDRLELIAQRRTLVRYDARGFGLSDRDVIDFSLDALVRDIEAIADHLALDRFQLMAGGLPVAIAIAYAAQHPARLTHLALDTNSPADQIDEDEVASLLDLADKNWELASEALAHAVMGWSNSVVARNIASLMREATTPETLRRFLEYSRTWDVAALLPRVAVPTLIITRRSGADQAMEHGRAIAAAIPEARLVMVEADDSVDPGFESIWSFLADGERIVPPAPELPHTTAVMLLTDIAGSTSLTERLGDAVFRQRSRDLDAQLRRIISDGGGTPVEGKVLGDGVMAVFPSARAAIDAGLACAAAGDRTGLSLHVGIHAGDVIRDGANVYGGAVNIAARITGAAEPGEVLVSDTVRGLARTSASVVFEDRGEHALRGIADGQRLYAVRPIESSAGDGTVAAASR